MTASLNVLVVEDSQDDADLIAGELRRAGFSPIWKRVETEADFLAEIKKLPDIILSDYSMPGFTGLRAAELLQKSGLNIPFILISGTVGEEIAVEAMKYGATDYLLKDRIARLGSAVQRALETKQLCQQRRQAEDELRESEKKFRQLAENINEVFWITDPLKHQMLYVSPAYEGIWGRTCGSLYQSPQSWVEAIHPEDRRRVVTAIMTKQEQGKYDETYRIVRPDGTVRWIRDKGFPVRNATGEPYRIVGTAEDITERRNLEARFIEAQKMEVVGRLASGVAHDFNNILAVITGYSDLIAQEAGQDGAVGEYNEKIRHALERAAGLTQQLLVFSRKQTVQLVVFDINEEVQDMDKMLRRLIDENITMTTIAGEHIWRIEADSGHMGQLLMNLVVNARDAMPDGGRLTIATNNVVLDENFAREHAGAMAGDYVMLSVSDTGTGMTDEVKAHMFEAFFTTKAKGKGTGLGLATCQTIVQQSGGYIDVDSELGKGTTFRIYFPRVKQPVEAAAQPARNGEMPRGTETLLIVEDEQSLRHLACDILEALGYEVLRASNGLHAMFVSREHKGAPIRLVITDVVMPQMGGKVMADWLKAIYPDLKILYTSGHTDEVIAEHGVLGAGVDFLPKPYTPAALACKVREVLDGTKGQPGLLHN
jgi:PAS domain S-box-containing protein